MQYPYASNVCCCWSTNVLTGVEVAGQFVRAVIEIASHFGREMFPEPKNWKGRIGVWTAFVIGFTRVEQTILNTIGDPGRQRGLLTALLQAKRSSQASSIRQQLSSLILNVYRRPNDAVVQRVKACEHLSIVQAGCGAIVVVARLLASIWKERRIFGTQIWGIELDVQSILKAKERYGYGIIRAG